MIKFRGFICLTLTVGLLMLLMIPVAAAVSDEKSIIDDINAMVQEQMLKSKIPGVSIAVIQNSATNHLFYGEGSSAENGLYQIGSTTKAFTALGVLWLADEGFISLNDPVSLYIPWFSVQYNGASVPNEDLTIANFLYQTSGFTNNETKFPPAQAGMPLEDNVRALTSCELEFYPSAQYAYANANYNILGLLIEIVSGESYQDFMDEKILKPLGLENTYADPAIAAETHRMVQGSRLAFFQNHPYDIPVNIASVPAGYILSDIYDMGRWLQIQMGSIETNEQFARLISESHMPSRGCLVDSDIYYAGGWFVASDGTIYHSGGTPNYSSRIIFNSESGIGVCVLTNMNASANTEQIAANIMSILEGKPPSAYQADIWTIFDAIFSILTFVFFPLLILVLLALVQTMIQAHNGKRVKIKWTKKSTAWVCLPAFFIVLSIAMIVIIPAIFGSSWPDIGIWAPYSLFFGVIAFALFSVGLFITTAAKSIWCKV